MIMDIERIKVHKPRIQAKKILNNLCATFKKIRILPPYKKKV